MKNIFLKFLSMVIVLSYGINANEKEISKQELMGLKKMNKILLQPNITILEGIDKGDYYFLKLQTKQRRGNKIIYAFLEKKNAALYTGSRYDAKGNKLIFPKTAKSIKSIKEGVSFSYGTGKKELYVVTDPECPYCIKFEKEVQDKLEDYRVHVILFPLHFHKRAPAMTEWIMQGKNDKERRERMEALMIHKSEAYKALMPKKGKPFKYTKEVKQVISKGNKAAKILGITGTPTVVDANFNKLNWKSLVTPPKKANPVQ